VQAKTGFLTYRSHPGDGSSAPLRLPRGFAAQGERRAEGEEAHDRARRQRSARQEPQRLPLESKPNQLDPVLTDLSRSSRLTNSAGYAWIRSLPSLHAHGVELGRSHLQPNAPEPRGRAASGHFLIETAKVAGGFAGSRPFRSAKTPALGRRGHLIPSRWSPAAGPIGRTRAAPDRGNDPASAAPPASRRAAV
jgi:hypothetical protein